ncbi:hypothetical protein CVD28_08930 [Bacillus sp. M6-12]|uniref:hypothetical protein n=1 Tax=Bacillus sp. M6-12 TaxID=2054166 RepID=UPI000C78B9E2|nr:hypothetical protein [Bacillus sp. M6-12]PLS17813.1 hypothetical protein CVD28_08930 [Bacillus sp. M6-12]
MKSKKGLIVGGTVMILLAIAIFQINNKALSINSVISRDTGLTAKSKDPQKIEELEKETKNTQNPEQEFDQTEGAQPLEKDENPEEDSPIEAGETSKGTEPAQGDSRNIIAHEAVSSKEDRTQEKQKATPEKKSSTRGLHFSSREEAIQFGLSRFSSEEIAIYNKAAKNGLTPEQETMAIQLAYSRFSAEEIAAIEAALKK